MKSSWELVQEEEDGRLKEQIRENILEMKPGFELDELVASNIMGWTKDSKPGGYWYSPGQPTLGKRVPSYSTDISKACKIVDLMREKGMWLYLSSDWSGGKWTATFRHESKNALQSEWRNTAPHAICEAALLAVIGVEK